MNSNHVENTEKIICLDQKEKDDVLKRIREETTSLVICEICKKEAAKYRCPRCLRATCSLDCCSLHKKNFDCDGKRDRTKFVSVKNFTDNDLYSDYFLLEEVARSTDNSRRELKKHFCSEKIINNRRKRSKHQKNETFDHEDLPRNFIDSFPKSVRLLLEHAKKRGVFLKVISHGMSKRNQNTSYVDIKQNILYWRIQWRFPYANVDVNLYENRVADNILLVDLLKKYLLDSKENSITRSKLQIYCHDNIDNNVVLMRKEASTAKECGYYRLDSSKSLQENFQRKVIVEFPELVVIPLDQIVNYNIIHDTIEEIESMKLAKPGEQSDGLDFGSTLINQS